MARPKDLETRLIATDDASKVIDKVADDLDALERRGDVEVGITADDKASPEIRSVSALLAGLSDEDRAIVLRAQVADAERDIARILKSLARVDEMDDEEIRIRVEALDNARGKLDRVQAQVRELDGETVDIKVETSGGGLEALDALPGRLGDLAGLAGAGGGLGAAAGAAAGIAAGLLAAADNAATMTLNAKAFADLTGSTIEDASRLLSVMSSVGLEFGDIADITVQVNQALEQSPDLASRVGVNLGDGRNAAERLAQVIGLANDGLISLTDQSALFGEEGIRQIAAVNAQIDDFTRALADVPEGVVFTEEDAARAADMKRQIAEVSAELQTLAVELGQKVIPLLDKLAGAADKLDIAKWGVWGEEVVKAINPVEKVLSLLEGFPDAGDDIDASLSPAFDEAAEAARDAAVETSGLARSTDQVTDAAERSREELERQVEQVYAGIAAWQAMTDARRAAADAAFALRDAERSFAEELTRWVELTGPESTATMADLAAAMDDTAQSAGKVADEQVRLADETAKADGTTLSAADAQRTWNASMLNSARTAEGPLRDAIIAYIAEVNGIPAEKVSEILADPQYDTIEEAQAALDAVVAARDAEMRANPTNTGPTSTALDNVANPGGRPRTANINVAYNPLNTPPTPGFQPRAAGLTAEPAGVMAADADGVAAYSGLFPSAPTFTFTAPPIAPVEVNVRVDAGVIADEFRLARIVRRATADGVRLAGSRP